MNPEMLELVLTELLEEQKKETITNAEMVSIIKRLLEKLEAIEQQIQPKDSPAILERLRAIHIACQGISEKPSPPSRTIPIQTVIRHHFYFKTTAVIATSFFILIVVLTWLYHDKRKEANAYKANDIKYRFMKLRAGPTLNSAFRLTDSLYQFAYDSLQKQVIWSKRQRQEHSESLQKSGKREQAVKQVRKEGDKLQLSK